MRSLRYYNTSVSQCSDISIYASVPVATVVWNEGAQSWVKLFTNHGSSCYKIVGQVVVQSGSD